MKLGFLLNPLRKFLQTHDIWLRRAQSSEGINALVDVLKLSGPSADSVILDVGANCGQTVLRLRQTFPTLPIFAFEPIQRTFEELTRTVRHLPLVTTVNAAVGAAPRKLRIYSQGTSELSSLRDTAPTSGAAVNEVEVITLDEFARLQGIKHIYLLKTDTEGFDAGVLRGARGLLTAGRVDFVLCEVGFDPKDGSHSHLGEIIDLMAQFDFTLASVYDVAGFWHLRRFGYTYANVLFVRRDICRRAAG
jgi:FkbM family methyltransferase